MGPDIIPIPGSRQSITITPGSTSSFYSAIFSFDENENMSEMSNVDVVNP